MTIENAERSSVKENNSIITSIKSYSDECLLDRRSTPAKSMEFDREADHRIKNSLQLLSSIIRMQARDADSQETRACLEEAASRVLVISSIHDAVQLQAGSSVIDLGERINGLCHKLQQLAGGGRDMSVVSNTCSLPAPIWFAQPILLAVNELVLNALRHAFAPGQAGTVCVSTMVQNGVAVIRVDDDGCGMPPSISERSGFGMRLVSMLNAQVSGEMTIRTHPGTQVTLRAPLPS